MSGKSFNSWTVGYKGWKGGGVGWGVVWYNFANFEYNFITCMQSKENQYILILKKKKLTS